jgi:hypothetical protein
MNDKEKIIESLQKVLCTSTSPASDSRVTNNDYFKRRVLGFRAEIEFEKAVKNFSQDLVFLEGGQFISKHINGEASVKNEFYYTTMDYETPYKYQSVYEAISKWDEVNELFFVQLLDEGWQTEEFNIKKEEDKKNKKGGIKKIKKLYKSEILKPSFIFYTFNKEKNKFDLAPEQDFSGILNCFSKNKNKPNIYHIRGDYQFKYFEAYDLKILKKIYATRYFIDNVMRGTKKHIIDLDGFIVKEEKVILVEIKEKEPIVPENKKQSLKSQNLINNPLPSISPMSDWQYGWDTRRLLWYLYLLNKINFGVMYNVRRINNRTDREFVQWDSLFIQDFLSGVSWSSSRGGGGGEDTLLAPYLYFKRLDEILAGL